MACFLQHSARMGKLRRETLAGRVVRMGEQSTGWETEASLAVD